MTPSRDGAGGTRTLHPLALPARAPGEGAGPLRRGVFVDCETTGLSAERDVLIELALLPFTYTLGGVAQVLEDEGQAYRNDPGRPLPKEVAHLTGLTDEDLRGERVDVARAGALLAERLPVSGDTVHVALRRSALRPTTRHCRGARRQRPRSKVRADRGRFPAASTTPTPSAAGLATRTARSNRRGPEHWPTRKARNGCDSVNRSALRAPGRERRDLPWCATRAHAQTRPTPYSSGLRIPRSTSPGRGAGS